MGPKKGFSPSLESWKTLSRAERKEKKTRWCSMVNNPVYTNTTRMVFGSVASKFESRWWDFFSLIDHARVFPPSSCNRFSPLSSYFYTFPFVLCYILYPFFVCGPIFFNPFGVTKVALHKTPLICYGRL